MTSYTLKVSLTHDSTALTRLREEWASLQNQSAADSLYLTWDWISLWWQHFGKGRELWLLEARDQANRLIGLAPLMKSNHRPAPGVVWQQLDFIAATSPCEHLGFIIEKEHEKEVITAFLDELKRHQAQWDVLSFAKIVENSCLIPILLDSGIPWQEDEPIIAPYITLPETMEAFLASSISRNHRKKLRKWLREMVAVYGENWSFYIVSNPAELNTALDDLIRLHQLKWEALRQPGAFGNPAVVEFHRVVARNFLEKGWLQLARLTYGGRIAATVYSFRYGKRVYDFASGIDNDLRYLKPGHLLTERAINEAIKAGMCEWDFLWGDEEYKYNWGAQDRSHRTFFWVASRKAQWQQRFIKVAKAGKRQVKKVLAQVKGGKKQPQEQPVTAAEAPEGDDTAGE